MTNACARRLRTSSSRGLNLLLPHLNQQSSLFLPLYLPLSFPPTPPPCASDTDAAAVNYYRDYRPMPHLDQYETDGLGEAPEEYDAEAELEVNPQTPYP